MMCRSILRSVVAVAVVIPCFSFRVAYCDEPDARSGETGVLDAERGAPASRRQSIARAHVWNSPEMVFARGWLKEYFASNRKYSAEQGTEYMTHLSQLSADEMKVWLAQFETWRGRLASRHQSWREAQRRGESRRSQFAPSPIGNPRQPSRIGQSSTGSAQFEQVPSGATGVRRPVQPRTVAYTPRVIVPWTGNPFYVPVDLYTPETFEIMQFLYFLDGPVLIRDRN